MKTKKLLICALLLSVTGCGGWMQDPLSGKDKKFLGGKEVPTKPDLGKPVPSNAVDIVAPLSVVFEEDYENSFQIISRVFLEGYELETRIDGLDQLPGAQYDEKTGRLSWKPAKGFVESKIQGENEFEFSLNVVAIARKEGAQSYMDEKDVVLRIKRQFYNPEITKVNSPATFVREGGVTRISVIVKDRDAKPDDESTYPVLMMEPLNWEKNLGGLTTIDSIEYTSNNEFRFILNIDARGEFTDSADLYIMGLTAISRHGKRGSQIPVELDVFTFLATPTSTWTETLEAKVGDAITYKFLISDPKQEGHVAIKSTDDLPAGATIDCQPQAIGILNCTLTWTPAEDQIGNHELTVRTVSRNRDSRDTFLLNKTLTFSAKIAPKGE